MIVDTGAVRCKCQRPDPRPVCRQIQCEQEPGDALFFNCPGPPGVVKHLSVFHRKSVFYGGFV